MYFKLKSDFKPAGDQPQAIEKLSAGLNSSLKEQVLLGVTGSGKTFTLANVINKIQLPTLVISHNKTLAAQLYQEFKSFFPQNAVSYFVSYYDYYQPEAYIPQSDTYIEKETEINEEIDKLRLSSTTNLLTRKDTLIVASVSCIYNIGSPKEYGGFILELRKGMKVMRQSILMRLIELMYVRQEYEFVRSSFRVRGEHIDVYPAYTDWGLRVTMPENIITKLSKINPVTGETIEELETFVLYPAKHYLTDPKKHNSVFPQIEKDLKEQIAKFKAFGKLLEAQRLEQRVTYDLEMIKEMGYVNGIENYSRYFDGRRAGDAPFTLLDYYQEKYGDKWLLIIDESHMTIPQIRGMYHGDRSRKQTLIDFGFRLPSALDNRPLRFEEFLDREPQTIYVSATPHEWELARVHRVIPVLDARIQKIEIPDQVRDDSVPGVVEQLIRPTGLVDPEIKIKPIKGQIQDLLNEISLRVSKKERVLVTTLTKRTAEDLASYLEEKGVRVHYLHSDIATLERTDILDKLRRGDYDVIVGINLLREGLDLPEVSLVAILDADKEGFLRSRVSLIQTMGRAARHINGAVLMYADKTTDSMKNAIDEVDRRRKAQLMYNKKHSIDPQTIVKPYRERLIEEDQILSNISKEPTVKKTRQQLDAINIDALTGIDRKKLVKQMEKQMRFYANDLNFELAVEIRDKIKEIKYSPS